MADEYYVWSKIQHGQTVPKADEKGAWESQITVIDRGEKITKKDLPGLSDEDWNGLIESGSIRATPVPIPSDYEGSVLDYMKEQLQELQGAADALDEAEVKSELADVEKAGAKAGVKKSKE